MPPSSSRYPGTPSVGRLMTAPQAQCRRGSMAFCRGWSRMAPALTRQRQTSGAAAPSPAAAAAPRSTTSARTNPHSRAKTHRAFVQSGFNEVLASAHVATLAPPRTSQKPPDSKSLYRYLFCSRAAVGRRPIARRPETIIWRWLRRYESTWAGTCNALRAHGLEDCSSEFRRLSNAQSEFEKAVEEFRSECP
jgi:hypothetical protein